MSTDDNWEANETQALCMTVLKLDRPISSRIVAIPLYFETKTKVSCISDKKVETYSCNAHCTLDDKAVS